ncbi:hypothetical protein M0813_06369 [Anaeramoeba flamelloides]|uniref:MULE transposase domain-containing protein n=1 Tax=Anaeramoeba flamelloides TaxID=1746091 RepID=A0ABQ8XDS8_9EUKA|nr:hypothetical protein M0813_06369 [Anaeramoeba flamelloides]
MENFFSTLTREENVSKQELFQRYLRFYKEHDNIEYVPERLAKGRIKRFYNDIHPKSINASIHHINEQSISGDQFLVLNTLRPFTVLSWSSPLMLNILQSTRHMFVDGTFLSAPSPFTQLFIIAAYNEQTRNYYVCNYTLLQGKKTENYEFVFNMLKFLVPGLNPTLITSDFEQSIINALNINFPSARIVHCKFHYAQCITRKIKGLKMVKRTKLKEFTRSLIELSATPVDQFRKRWDHIVVKYQKREKYKIVLNYFYNTFLVRFPIHNWNYSILGESFKHTNGFLENNNGVLNKAFKNRKPGLNTLIYILKKHEDSQSRLFNSRMNKELKKDKNNYYNAREIEDRIEIEKSKWVKLQNQLKDTHFSPVQEETQINYKNINKFYNSENVLKHRTNFNKAEKLKKKKKQENIEKSKKNIYLTKKIKNTSKNRKLYKSKKKLKHTKNINKQKITLQKIKKTTKNHKLQKKKKTV